MDVTVLIVDDSAGFRALARQLLQEAGFVVVGEAADGRSALEVAGRVRPELVLVDVQLPDIDGLTLTGLLRAPATSTPEVVLTSTRDAADYGQPLTMCGALGFVAKAELSGESLSALLRTA
jgi:DNA-binding NarL/FixJ family response regulator